MRSKILVAAASALAVSALALATPASAAPQTNTSTTSPAAVTPLVSCHVSVDNSRSFTFNGATFSGFGFAGFYSGLSVVPSTHQVTSSGLEAQCLLTHAGYNPGTIDGVFGPNSQAAMHAFQTDMNFLFGAGLATGPGEDLPGPHSWKWLRWWAGF